MSWKSRLKLITIPLPLSLAFEIKLNCTPLGAITNYLFTKIQGFKYTSLPPWWILAQYSHGILASNFGIIEYKVYENITFESSLLNLQSHSTRRDILAHKQLLIDPNLNYLKDGPKFFFRCSVTTINARKS